MQTITRLFRIIRLTVQFTFILWIVTTPPLIYLDNYIARWTKDQEKKACGVIDQLNAAAAELQKKPKLVGTPITLQDLVKAGVLDESVLHKYTIGHIYYCPKLPPPGNAYAWWVYDGVDGHYEYPPKSD